MTKGDFIRIEKDIFYVTREPDRMYFSNRTSIITVDVLPVLAKRPLSYLRYRNVAEMRDATLLSKNDVIKWIFSPFRTNEDNSLSDLSKLI